MEEPSVSSGSAREPVYIIDMTPDERDAWHEEHGCEMTRKLHQERKQSGYYDLCKRDVCKEMRDKQEREDKKRRDDDEEEKKRIRERSKILEENARILVEHGRDQETKVKEQASHIDALTQLLTEQADAFEAYRKLTDERFDKLASLILNKE
jgi:hypothetical protein